MIKQRTLDSCITADFVSSWHEVKMDGPQHEQDIATREAGTDNVVLDFSDFGKKLAQRWLERHGRRFKLYKTRSDKGQARGHRKGSEAWCLHSQRKGRDLLAKGKGTERFLLGPHISKTKLKVVPSDRRAQFEADDSLVQFRRTTLLRYQAKLARNDKFKKNRDPYPVGTSRLGNIFRNLTSPMNELTLGAGRNASIEAINASTCTELPSITGATVRSLEWLKGTNLSTVMQRLRKSRIVIVDCLADIDHESGDTQTTLSLE